MSVPFLCTVNWAPLDLFRRIQKLRVSGSGQSCMALGFNLFCVTERALITRRGSKFQNVVRKICTKSFAKPYGQIYGQIYGQLEIDGLQSDVASRLV